MVFCRCCGKEIHESAPTCPHCGGVQIVSPDATASRSVDRATVAAEGPLWLGITSLVLSILSALALLDEDGMDKDTLVGFLMFTMVSIVLGTVSVKNYMAAKKMAIAGIVISSISVLILIGIHTK